MSSDIDNLREYVDQFDERAEKDMRALTMLIDQYAQKKGKGFAIKSAMGSVLNHSGTPVPVPSFVISQTLDWVGKELKMGSEMPFMQHHLDEKGLLKIDESNAEDVKQRAPDWTRQPAIAAYLAHDHRRKFGTIVAVLSPPWVDDPNHENWGKDDRAVRSAFDFEAFDSLGSIGLIDLSQSLIYALDGQHRVMGIRGIQDLRDKGFLEMRDRLGKPKKDRVLNKEEFLEKFELTIGDLQSLLGETMAIELLPAVLVGETRKDASKRIRSVFVTINAYAKPTGKSENALLNESDGFAIIARKAGTIHDLFREDRVNWKGPTLPKRTKWYTTLQTIRDMASNYLSAINSERESKWGLQFAGQVPVTPTESDIEDARHEFFDLLDRVHAMPTFAGLEGEGGDDIDEVRLFPGFDPEDPSRGRGHLLLRPVGQVILSKAVGRLIKGGLSLDEIFHKLDSWDRAGGFSQHLPDSVWYGVTYDFLKDKMNTRTNLELGARILRYMVNGMQTDEREELLAELINARSVGKPGESKWRGFKGKDKNFDPDDVIKGESLPKPIPAS